MWKTMWRMLASADAPLAALSADPIQDQIAPWQRAQMDTRVTDGQSEELG